MIDARTVPHGQSAPETAITLLRDCIAALQRHPRDAKAVAAASRAFGFLANFPTHFVTEYLVKDPRNGVELRRAPLSEWPEWADHLHKANHRVAFNFEAHLTRQREWSGNTFGPGDRAQGVVDHIRKELLEIEADPGDLKEWVDVVILALDGAWRSGHSPAQIIEALEAKQLKNEGRTWPDWRTADPTKAIEHDRSGEGQADA